MKKKLAGSLVMMLFIAAAVLPVAGRMNDDNFWLNDDWLSDWEKEDTSWADIRWDKWDSSYEDPFFDDWNCDPKDCDDNEDFETTNPDQSLNNENSEVEMSCCNKEHHETTKPPECERIKGNCDWDYWTNPSNMFAIPEGNVGIGTTTPEEKLEVNGNIKWGDTNLLQTDQGGSIELGNSSGIVGMPYIDFHYGQGMLEDYNVRLINDEDGRLSIHGSLHVEDDITMNPKTSYLSIAPCAFNPAEDQFDYGTTGERFYVNDGNDNFYYAPVQLPHGAVVESVTYHFYDVTILANSYCDLYRSDFISAQEMAHCYSSVDTGYGSNTDTSINYATIDNQNYCYYLRLDLHHTITSAMGVVIEYTVTQPY